VGHRGGEHIAGGWEVVGGREVGCTWEGGGVHWGGRWGVLQWEVGTCAAHEDEYSTFVWQIFVRFLQ